MQSLAFLFLILIVSSSLLFYPSGNWPNTTRWHYSGVWIMWDLGVWLEGTFFEMKKRNSYYSISVYSSSDNFFSQALILFSVLSGTGIGSRSGCFCVTWYWMYKIESTYGIYVLFLQHSHGSPFDAGVEQRIWEGGEGVEPTTRVLTGFDRTEAISREQRKKEGNTTSEPFDYVPFVSQLSVIKMTEGRALMIMPYFLLCIIIMHNVHEVLCLPVDRVIHFDDTFAAYFSSTIPYSCGLLLCVDFN